MALTFFRLFIPHLPRVAKKWGLCSPFDGRLRQLMQNIAASLLRGHGYGPAALAAVVSLDEILFLVQGDRRSRVDWYVANASLLLERGLKGANETSFFRCTTVLARKQSVLRRLSNFMHNTEQRALLVGGALASCLVYWDTYTKTVVFRQSSTEEVLHWCIERNVCARRGEPAPLLDASEQRQQTMSLTMFNVLFFSLALIVSLVIKCFS